MKKKKEIKEIPVKNLNLELANYMLSTVTPKPLMAHVLSKIMEFADKGVITQPILLSPYVCDELHISPESFRQCMLKLYKKKLLVKSHDMIFLLPMLRGPFSEITFLQKRGGNKVKM